MYFTNTFRAFHHRDYFIFWCALFLGHTGTLMQTTAQSWLIFQLTNSPFYLGLEGILGGPHARIDSPLSKAPSPAVLSRRGFRIVHRSFRRLAPFLPVAIDFVYRRRIPNHFPFRHRNAAANSRRRNQPGSHHVAFRLDQSRAWTDG